MIRFFVDGDPVTQGSTRAVPDRHSSTHVCPRCNRPHYERCVTIQDHREALVRWRRKVAEAARSAWGLREAYDGPVRVHLVFCLARPASHLGTGRNAGTVKPSAPPHPLVKPDVDKLARAILDALVEGHVITDDSRVVELTSSKLYNRRPGVQIAWEAAL